MFKIKLADKIIGIQPLYHRVFDMCREYQVDDAEPVDITVTITEDDIDYERQKSEDGQDYSDSYLETLAVYRQIAEKAPEFRTFLMHGAVFAIGDRACMVTAPSGTGKTTLLQKIGQLNKEVYVVNGDKPLIRIDKEDHLVYACGTPWSGKEHYQTNCCVPLKTICFLKRGQENAVKEVTFSKVMTKMLAQTYRPEKNEKYLQTLKLIGEMKDRVKFFEIEMKMYDTVEELEDIAAEKILEIVNDYNK